MNMFADTTYAKTMKVAKKLLNVYGLRAEVISDNIANVSTPNFKRSDVTFEYQLARALDSEKYNGMEAKRTDSRHFPFHMPMNYQDVSPNITVDYDTSYRNDKNNVDIDKEMSEEAKNTLRYQMFTQIVNAQYREIRRMIGNA
ncbi:flagellar basal body rod protein FlgB [Brachyspira sp.]|uniref:flagellar basal body rod protein FlgB n=1 Tax=Brachyspira sp. TaxID=1977261 RepID=UPI0026120F20|nr:flagellar basal body rod protein FlgB [Brachyspira sp.]